MAETIIKKLKEHVPELKSRFKVQEIGVFGSQIKGKAKKRSDIDILVEFEKEWKTFDNYMELKFYLEKQFHRRIDLVIKSALKEDLKADILSEVIYV